MQFVPIARGVTWTNRNVLRLHESRRPWRRRREGISEKALLLDECRRDDGAGELRLSLADDAVVLVKTVIGTADMRALSTEL